IPIHAAAPSGVDAAFWGAPGGAGAARRGVLWSYSPIEHKGGEEGAVALVAVHRELPGIPIRAFGQARRPRLPAFIEYHRRPRDETLRDLYASSEVFLYSSRFEGCGLPPLEAQAAGCAVVSTRVGDVPEFIREGENGVLVEPCDAHAMARAVIALLREPERRERLGRAARAGVAAFGWERSTDDLARALECALARGRQRSSAGEAR
ncbi:MAG: glycosyltransferase family 4 protein, partial [Candidatus Eiseniibacteriota bacterium]